MWRRKKFVIIALLAAMVLVGTIGGVVFAQTGSSDNTTSGKTLVARVAAILGIDEEKVQDAFLQARSEMQNEALDNYLKSLVDQGKISQEQADQYKAWVKSKPDMSQYQQLKDWMQARPGISPELKAWRDARPNMPLPGVPGRFGMHGFNGGMKMGRGHGFGGGMMGRGGSF